LGLSSIGTESLSTSWGLTLEYISKILHLKSSIDQDVFYLIGQAGQLVDAFGLQAYSTFFGRVGYSFYNNFFQKFDADFRDSYILNLSSILGADTCFLFGLNPRLESPAFNLKIQSVVKAGKISIYSCGFFYPLNYSVLFENATSENIAFFLFGRSELSSLFANSINPSILVGFSIFRVFGASIIDQFKLVLKNVGIPIKNFGIFFPFSNLLTGFELGLNSKSYNDFGNIRKVIFAVKNDELDFEMSNYSSEDTSLPDNILFYQGSHGDYIADFAHFILPSSTHLEQNSLFITLIGGVRSVKQVLEVEFTDIRADFEIPVAILDWSFKNIFSYQDQDFNNNWFKDTDRLLIPRIINVYLNIFEKFIMNDIPFFSFINNFYSTEALTRSSQNLSLASKFKELHQTNFKF